jgi:hypothetical protein
LDFVRREIIQLESLDYVRKTTSTLKDEEIKHNPIIEKEIENDQPHPNLTVEEPTNLNNDDDDKDAVISVNNISEKNQLSKEEIEEKISELNLELQSAIEVT